MGNRRRRLPSPGFSVYLVAGFPDPKVFRELVESLESCIDFLELGIPTVKPKYDGPTIRVAHRMVTSRGLVGLDALKLLPEGFSKPVVVMGYLEDFEGRLGEVAEAARSVGAWSVLLPDLPFEYPLQLEEYVEVMRDYGLEPSFFASSKFPHSWLRRYAELDPLFVYLGLQPATGVKLPIAVERNIRLARELIGPLQYLLAGFAIREPWQAARVVGAGADAVVVGSALIRRVLEEGVASAVRFACEMYGAVHSARS